MRCERPSRERCQRFVTGLLSCALFLLPSTGCTVGMDYSRPQIAIPENHRGLAGPPVEASLADIPWWEATMGEDILTSLIKEAVENNTDLRAATARVEEYRALSGIARADFYPQIGYGISASRQESALPGIPATLTYNTYETGMSASWELDLWGKITRSNEAAVNQLLSTVEARRGVYLSLVTSVAQAYLELRELDLELEIADRTLASRKTTLDLFRKQLLGGIATKLDVSQAAAAVAQTEAVLPQIREAIFLKENQITQLLGRKPGTIPRGRALVKIEAPGIPAGLPSALLERRPDVKQAEHTLAAANAQTGVAHAKFFPQISLTGALGSGSTDLSDLLNSGSFVWNLGAGITGPIFQGGRLIQNLEAAKAQWEQARAQYERTALSAFGDVANALEAHRRTIEIKAAQRRNVEVLEEAERIALLRYDGGVSSYLDVLDAQRQLFSAEISLARVIRDRYLSVIQLYRALGGGWNKPETPPPSRNP